MKYFHLIWAALFRSRTRTLLTLLSVVAASLKQKSWRGSM